MPKMKKFKFIWKGSGEEQIGEGYDVADAFRRLGYGGEAIRALEAYREVEEEERKNV